MTAKDFIYSLPKKVPSAALEGAETLFHFDLTGEEDGGQYSLEIKEGKLEVKEGFEGEPKCKVTSKAANFVKVVTGEINPMMALLTGKIKISNQGEMLKYAKVFGLM